ncbi:grasp-with-spasm system ATP-grasp peptide maturase [Taibaiella chishuiensis]|uniref:ATP-GRASP peptide maturase of grasp-with-spasm system n=1 Tax=Taibaiella chishuiensis TaxID=1434707 RepID=A0A2P8D5S0_9BACT|nr:grasp-with-spasm system ATP-grasp peptide maturase [Taibaiella chishuiensis]PSK92539.1 ATP-GRASP peptide maturase of grasp-with-spasm system [Taibaiella chishuiensis]
MNKKKLLVQSSSTDASTNDVLDWLYYLSGGDYAVVRLNDTGYIRSVTVQMNNREQRICLATQDRELYLDELDSRWYRRGRLSLPAATFTKTDAETFALALHTRRYVDAETDVVCNFIENNLDRYTASLNRQADDGINKLDLLQLAAELGISIPDTLVTNERQALLAFGLKYPMLVTKSLGRNAFTCPLEQAGSVKLGMGTVLINAADINTLYAAAGGPLALPALYQQYVDKQLELRIFYLDGAFYPMAIFSQADARTRVDFRHYDPARPNRCVPYQLPEPVERKLDALMQHAGLTSGSVDMILTPDNDYVFLEVNPVGQFQWLARNCNYDIDRQIAAYLLNGYDDE